MGLLRAFGPNRRRQHHHVLHLLVSLLRLGPIVYRLMAPPFEDRDDGHQPSRLDERNLRFSCGLQGLETRKSSASSLSCGRPVSRDDEKENHSFRQPPVEKDEISAAVCEGISFFWSSRETVSFVFEESSVCRLHVFLCLCACRLEKIPDEGEFSLRIDL